MPTATIVPVNVSACGGGGDVYRCVYSRAINHPSYRLFAVMDPSQVLLHHHQQQHTKLESAGHSLDSFSLENQHLLKVDGASKPALETSSDGGSSSVATSTSQQQQQQQQQKSKGKGKENNGGGGGLLNVCYLFLFGSFH